MIDNLVQRIDVKVFLLLSLVGFVSLILVGCGAKMSPDPVSIAPSDSPTQTATPIIKTITPVPITRTVTDEPVVTSMTEVILESTDISTGTPTSTNTQSPTETPSPTLPPPTPSGEDAIYIYGIQNKTDDSKKCDFIAVAVNTGLWRTGDTSSDVKSALRNIFSKRPYFGGLENPAYLSNIKVDTVDFKPYSGLVSIRMSGTYVRSGNTCDDSKVRAQVWTTIRQFDGIKTIDILLNGNLLGDILATGK